MKVLAFLLLAAVPAIQATVTGLTYMDDMDFASRYRNVHECDPFYYHPLHLPEHCADMFEKLIRSKIGSRGALRVITDGKYEVAPVYDYAYKNADDASVEHRKLTPHEMLFSLDKDVESNPREVMWSNIGPVAVLRPPITQVSKDVIHQYFKKTSPKRKSSKKNGLKMNFWYGKNKIELKVDKNDNYVMYDVS